MNIVPLTNEEQIKTDCQFKVIVKYTDFTSTVAATAQTINITGVPAGFVFSKIISHTITAFTGGAISAYGISMGTSTAGTVALLANNSAFTAPILTNTAVALTSVAATTITATATPVTGACSAATAGEVHYYFQAFAIPAYQSQ